MTTVTAHPTNAPALQKAVIRSWKAPIGLGAFTLIAIVLFLVFSRKGESVFPLATGADAIRLPNVTVNAALACWVLVILLAIVAAIATWLTVQARRVPRSLFILF
ncbi:MAG: ral nucleoside transport system permease protein, partial [Actinomycetota bacterium]|nr:ral nucleoside transport system permease protein [Actinomycetota bacterium]